MKVDMQRRVVVTGMGALSSVGNNVPDMWDGLLAGRSGIGPITRWDPSDMRTRIAGELKNFRVTDYISAKEARKNDPFTQYALIASAEAVAHAQLDFNDLDCNRIGVLIGSGIGGIQTLSDQVGKMNDGGPGKVSPFLVPMMIGDMASGMVAIKYGLRGPNFGVVSACATGAHAIGEAAYTIRRGEAEIVLAGGAEAPIVRIGVAGFCSMKAMSERNDDPEGASRPFDADRDGFVVAEGAGVLVLEELEHAKARGVPILGELSGYGATADAYHITAPPPDGHGAERALRRALQTSGLQPADIGYVNAHGTSTPMNDKFETMALKKVLGEAMADIPVSSTKSLTGHTLGAAGGIESIVCLLAIANGKLPGTYNYTTPDPDCDLDYIPNQTREAAVDHALCLNFGFGGHNAVLAFSRYRAS